MRLLPISLLTGFTFVRCHLSFFSRVEGLLDSLPSRDTFWTLAGLVTGGLGFAVIFGLSEGLAFLGSDMTDLEQKIDEDVQEKNALRLLDHLAERYREELQNSQRLRARIQYILLATSTVFGLVVSNLPTLKHGAIVMLIIALLSFLTQFGLSLISWLPYDSKAPGTTDFDKAWFDYVEERPLLSVGLQIKDYMAAIDEERIASAKMGNQFIAFLVAAMVAVFSVVLAFVFAQ